MTVTSETSESTHPCNGLTTAFVTGFYFTRPADLKVRLDGVLQTLGVHYTVALPSTVGGSGTVTMLVAPSGGAELVITRDVDIVQDQSFRTQGQFSPAVHEDAMDRIVFGVQELDRRLKLVESGGPVGDLVAGDGVYLDGTTLHVGAGDGITLSPDAVNVEFGAATTVVYAGGEYNGIETTAARSDHGHNVATDAPLALAAGSSIDPGVATALARADHVHGVPTAAPVNVTKAANAEGVSTSFARADHKHDITTAAAVALTDTSNAEGSSSSLARADHTHAHGDRGGGTLHAVATAGTAGFLSAADKVLLDDYFGTIKQATVQTANATPTTLLSWSVDSGTAELIELLVVAKKKSDSVANSYARQFLVKRQPTTTIVGTVDTIGADKADAAWTIAVTASSPNVVVTVTGVDATDIVWKALARRLIVAA